jgi:hypothetical protein
LEDVVGAAQLPRLFAQLLQLLLFIGGESCPLSGIDLGLLHPASQRFITHPELTGNP